MRIRRQAAAVRATRARACRNSSALFSNGHRSFIFTQLQSQDSTRGTGELVPPAPSRAWPHQAERWSRLHWEHHLLPAARCQRTRSLPFLQQPCSQQRFLSEDRQKSRKEARSLCHKSLPDCRETGARSCCAACSSAEARHLGRHLTIHLQLPKRPLTPHFRISFSRIRTWGSQEST